MLTQPLLQQLHELRLRGMAAGLEQQISAHHQCGPELRGAARTFDPTRVARATVLPTAPAAALGALPAARGARRIWI